MDKTALIKAIESQLKSGTSIKDIVVCVVVVVVAVAVATKHILLLF